MNRFKLIDVSKRMDLWDDVIRIYDHAFPEWEKESPDNILQHVQNGKYRMTAYLENGEVKGFSILDNNERLHYTLFIFINAIEFYILMWTLFN